MRDRSWRDIFNLRFLDSLGFNMPASEVVLKHSDKAFLRVITIVGASDCPCYITVDRSKGDFAAHPKMRSGWDMKSVMRSSMLRGSRTKVGNVTLERSMPTLVECGVINEHRST
jgi:hypothetical protein